MYGLYLSIFGTKSAAAGQLNAHSSGKKTASQGCRKRGAGGAQAPPVFGRSVNPISTRGGGAHSPHPVLQAPPDFQTLRRPCYIICLYETFLTLYEQGPSGLH